jgi:hypothetical protein
MSFFPYKNLLKEKMIKNHVANTGINSNEENATTCEKRPLHSVSKNPLSLHKKGELT